MRGGCVLKQRITEDGNFHSLHSRVCIDNLNEIRSVFTHCFLYFLTLFFRNTTCFGCHQPSSGVSNSRHRFSFGLLTPMMADESRNM
jgi:hypothetical protein